MVALGVRSSVVRLGRGLHRPGDERGGLLSKDAATE